MPPMTRDQARGAYDHVVGSVLDQDRDAPLRLALEKEGVSNIMHLLIMPEATIDAMTYDIPGDGTQAANADIPLQNVHKWTLKAFQSYAQYRSDVEEVDNGNLDEWRAINQGEFHNFQCNIFPSLGYTNTRIHSTPTGWPGTTCSPLSPIAEWKKRVERDMALYLEPQQDKEWDRWNTQLRATANTQEVDRVLDPNFHPRDAEDRALFKAEDANFPSESTEARGHRVGIANHVGHEMTYKILTDDTSKVIYRSSLQTALSTTDHSKHVDLLDGEELTPVLKSPDGEHSQAKPLPVFDSSDLLGRTFLVKHKGDGEPATAKIIKEITDRDSRLADQPERKCFLASVYDDEFQDVVTHNEILDNITQQEKTKEPTDLWRFQHTSGHQGLLKSTDKDYNGLPYNVQVEWANGETTYEPLSIIVEDDPVSCAIYAKENGLLDTPGWHHFKPLAKQDPRQIRMANKAKLKPYSRMPKFKFGYQVPHNHMEAMLLDQKNGNTKWAEAEAQEMKSFQECGVFKDLGKRGKPPEGYKKVKLIMVYDVKHDGKHVTLSHFVNANLYHDIVTGRLVTGIHDLTNKTPIDRYSKKQGTVKTATFGSKFAAAQTCTEQIIDLQDTLRYMGVPIREKSYTFGDNKTVVNSSNTMHGKLHKQHTMLAHHRVQEAIASDIIHFVHIHGDINPADILGKHWGFQQIWKQLQPLLLWPGDTCELFDKEARAK